MSSKHHSPRDSWHVTNLKQKRLSIFLYPDDSLMNSSQFTTALVVFNLINHESNCWYTSIEEPVLSIDSEQYQINIQWEWLEFISDVAVCINITWREGSNNFPDVWIIIVRNQLHVKMHMSHSISSALLFKVLCFINCHVWVQFA